VWCLSTQKTLISKEGTTMGYVIMVVIDFVIFYYFVTMML